MKKDNLDISTIKNKIGIIESEFNKIDEWLIPRDRSSFYLTHDYHPYFAAFPPQLVSRLLEKYSTKGDILLDPFMGGGSAIVEGFLLQRKTIGLDISPLSKFITEVKSMPIMINDEEIKTILCDIRNDIFKYKMTVYKNFEYPIPNVTNIDRWFTKESKLDLAIILHHIRKIEHEHLQKFLLLAFSSIVRKVSNATNGQLHLCTKKNKRIPLSGSLFEKKVSLMVKQMNEYRAKISDNYLERLPKLYVHDVRKMSNVIEPEGVDVIITSPPYGTGSKYTNIYRLNFEWLGFRKPSIKETMERAKDFKSELKTSLDQMYRVLKEGKYCLFVYGDPSTEDSLTKVAIDDAISIGFRYKGLISCPIKKIQSNHHEKYIRFIPRDFILIFKK